MKKYLLAVLLTITGTTSWAQGTVRFMATINGAQSIPANNSPFTAQAAVFLDGNVIGVEINQLGSLMTGQGDAFVQTSTGGSVFTLQSRIFVPPFDGVGGGAIYDGSFALSESQVTDLHAGRLFVAIASAQNPNGEIRGQILAVPEPGTLSLLGLGLAAAGIAAARRRRRP